MREILRLCQYIKIYYIDNDQMVEQKSDSGRIAKEVQHFGKSPFKNLLSGKIVINNTNDKKFKLNDNTYNNYGNMNKDTIECIPIPKDTKVGLCDGGLKKDGTKCTNEKCNKSNFCTDHQDLVSYTKKMLANQTYCGRCYNFRYCGENATCEKCKHVNKIYNKNKKQREKDGICILCTQRRRIEFGDYCWHHRTEYFKIEAAKQNKKVCNGGNRGCRELLPYNCEYEKCESCMEYYNAKDRERHRRNIDNVIESRENNTGTCLCLNCGEVKNIDSFLTKNNEPSYNCSACRLKACIYDKSRTRRNIRTNEKTVREYIRSVQPHRRKKIWSLTMEQALDIISKPCHYCGSYDEKINDNGVTYSNMGIDRVDNKKDYVIDNVVPACSMCNFMKYTYSYDDFIEYCINIYRNYGSKTRKINSHRPYAQYRYDAQRRKIPFKIDHHMFDQILGYDCFYCNGKNNTGQIGIDRINSDLPYCTKINQLVAACSICNQMKKNYTIGNFYNQILKILLFNKKITEYEYNRKLKPGKDTDIKQLILDLKKSLNNHVLNDTEFPEYSEHNEIEKQYIENIWKSYDCSTILPCVTLCETMEEIDKWNFYRKSLNIKDYESKSLKFMITDTNSGKHIGIIELSEADSVLMGSQIIKDFINIPIDSWSQCIKNIISVTVCEPLQPFGHNFCGKTLLLKLLHSKQMYHLICQKMKKTHILGFLCYSSESDKIQHYGIKEFECLGFDPDFNLRVIDHEILKKVTEYLKSQKVPMKHNIRDNLPIFQNYLDMNNLIRNDGQKWIHFGSTDKNWRQYLSMDTKELVELVELVPGRDKIDEIEAITKNTFRTYDMNPNEIDKEYEENMIRQIVKYWHHYQNDTFSRLSTKLSLKLNTIIDEEFIISVIYGNTGSKMIDTTYYDDVRNHIKEYKYSNVDKCYEKLCKRASYLNEISDDELIIDVNQDHFNVCINEQKDDFIPIHGISYAKTNQVIDNLVTGKWKITKSRMGDPNILFEMYSLTENDQGIIAHNEIFDESEKLKSHTITNNDHLIQCISLSGSDENNRMIKGVKLHTYIFKCIDDSMIHIKSNQNTKMIRILQQCNKNGKTCGIKIIDETSIDSYNPQNSDHSECWCNFKGTFIKN
jgi:hypothetical protein